MKKTIEILICDICKKEVEKIKSLTIPVIFHTDQTEGRECKPYISMEKLDICEECATKITNVHGWGAQGYNEYKLQLKAGVENE